MLSQVVAFFRQILSAVGVEEDCRYIFGNFGAMLLVAKPPWKACFTYDKQALRKIGPAIEDTRRAPLARANFASLRFEMARFRREMNIK